MVSTLSPVLCATLPICIDHSLIISIKSGVYSRVKHADMTRHPEMAVWEKATLRKFRYRAGALLSDCHVRPGTIMAHKSQRRRQPSVNSRKPASGPGHRIFLSLAVRQRKHISEPFWYPFSGQGAIPAGILVTHPESVLT